MKEVKYIVEDVDRKYEEVRFWGSKFRGFFSSSFGGGLGRVCSFEFFSEMICFFGRNVWF